MNSKFSVNTKSAFNLSQLDGLRAIAILLVLVHHAWNYTGTSNVGKAMTKLFDIGWVGVEIFFVLSGFLICTVLLQLRNEENYFKKFYFRRIFRIFPLYYACLFALFVAALLIQSRGAELPASLQGVDRIWANALYVTNLMMAFNGFDWAFFRPTWTLALEEQFYLIFPFFVAYMSATRLRSVLILVVVLTPVLKLVLLAWTNSYDLIAMFPLCRFDGFSAGAIVALLVWNKEEIKLIVIKTIAISSLFISAYFLFFSYRSEITFIAVAYTSIYLLIGTLIYVLCRWVPRSLSFLSNGFLVKIGQLSYSLYLLHMFVRGAFDFAWKVDPTSIADAFIRLFIICILSLIASWFSYKFFEQPIRKYGYNWLAGKVASNQGRRLG